MSQGVKHIKRSNGNEHAITLSRIQAADEGEYVVRAQNQYGSVQEQAYLQVQSESFLFEYFYYGVKKVYG